MENLVKGHCVPCEGGTKPLTSEQIEDYFKVLSGWKVVENTSIIKQYQCKDFAEALSFVNAVGAIAESEGHHPDMNLFGWNKVAVTLSTHAIGGLSTNDFILAAKIDAMKNKSFPMIS